MSKSNKKPVAKEASQEKFVWEFLFKDGKSLILEVSEEDHSNIEESIESYSSDFWIFRANSRKYIICQNDIKICIGGPVSEMRKENVPPAEV